MEDRAFADEFADIPEVNFVIQFDRELIERVELEHNNWKQNKSHQDEGNFCQKVAQFGLYLVLNHVEKESCKFINSLESDTWENLSTVDLDVLKSV